MIKKEEIAREIVDQWMWILDQTSSDLPTLQDCIEYGLEKYDKHIEKLNQEIEKIKLLYENEVLNSQSLERYWRRAVDELETFKNKS